MATEGQKKATWNKAKTIRGKSPDAWRRDAMGNIIRLGSYGTHGQFGWDVDHVRPKAKGGTDAIDNLQALQWEANIKKGDKS